MEKMDSSLIHRSCTFIIVSSYVLSWNGKDGLITYSSFMYIHNSLFICFKLKWKRWTHLIVHVHIIFTSYFLSWNGKMGSSLIHRSCTFIIVSSYVLSWNGKDGLITYSSFMYIHNSLFICFKLKWKRWTHHLFIVHVHS